MIFSAVTLAYLPHARWTALVDNRWRTSVGINLGDGACLLLIKGKLAPLCSRNAEDPGHHWTVDGL